MSVVKTAVLATNPGLDPKLDEAYTVRGEAKVGKGDYDGAIVDFSKAIGALLSI